MGILGSGGSLAYRCQYKGEECAIKVSSSDQSMLLEASKISLINQHLPNETFLPTVVDKHVSNLILDTLLISMFLRLTKTDKELMNLESFCSTPWKRFIILVLCMETFGLKTLS